ncbi:MAG: cyclophilin-like superfamily protein [Chloroflexi bacterium 13_1_40CM_3_70_6]|nr:MAG: cyclophilin-like superfamily protein [Chloroflexi bacterium 13_1_40CM_3_70_6]
MRTLRISAGPYTFKARLLEQAAPKTCAAIRKLLPLRSRLVHARWSGEATWVPMGERRLGVDYENHTSHPAPGEILVYPGGISEMEILFPYGATLFASKVGQLAGNHFATVIEGHEHLAEVGRLVLWEGAQDFAIEEE